MISVPPWVLAAAVVLAGCAIFIRSMYPEDKKTRTRNGPNAGLGALGMLIIAAGLRLLWIGPNPEPLSAWIGIAVGAAGSCIAINRANVKSHETATTILVTSGLIAATLIVRASIPGFH